MNIGDKINIIYDLLTEKTCFSLSIARGLGITISSLWEVTIPLVTLVNMHIFCYFLYFRNFSAVYVYLSIVFYFLYHVYVLLWHQV